MSDANARANTVVSQVALAGNSSAGHHERSVAVELSRVSFLDSSCPRELVVYQRLRPGHVVLCDPSPQVELSAAACGVEACIRFCSAARDRSEAAGVPRSAKGGERGCW